jgi:IMP dehydrogenase
MDIYSIPLIASCMDTVYSLELDKLLTEKKIMVMVHRYFNDYKEQLENSPGFSSDYRFYAVGSTTSDKGKQWIDGLIDAGIKHFVVDMAHGDSAACSDTVRYINQNCNDAKIIAGNVAVKSGFRRLQDAGAWAIRCGIGSGSICSTRTSTGFGVPLLTTVEDCAMVKDGAYLIADGGVKNHGDIPKVISFGADFVMSGRLWAGTDLSAGDCYDKNKELICGYNDIDEYSAKYDSNRKRIAYKSYRGMASKAARQGVMKDSSIEGVSGLIPYTGTTEDFIKDLTNNLRASLSYAGAYNWKEFRMNAKRIRISGAAWSESQTFVL